MLTSLRGKIDNASKKLSDSFIDSQQKIEESME
jgi:hypothetical protein